MTDFRALCAELVNQFDELYGRICDDDTVIYVDNEVNELMSYARAALAEAVPEGREPASVTEQTSDEDIMGLMPQQMHEDLADAVRAMAERESIDSTAAKGVMRIMLNRHVVDLARAVLARWGNPAPQPVPVSERLPGPENCDAEGRCWVWWKNGVRWVLDEWTHHELREGLLSDYVSHWLPAHAIPIPTAND